MSCEAPGEKLEAPRLLLLFETIRRALIEEGGLVELAGDWSIRAETLPGHLGSCWVEHGDWQQLDDSTRQATLCQIQHVAIRLTPDSGGPTYPLEALMLTLLHEFAHVMAPSLLRKGGPKGREWREDAHGPEFYAAFASVLHAAERLNLFVLPSAPNKHSPHSLSRLDRYEPSSGLLPHSCVPTATRARLWSGGQGGEGEGEGPPQRISCRVTVAHVNRGKTVRKPLVVHAEMEMGEFMEQVRAKLRLAKTPEVVRNQRGDAWDGFSLSMIHPDMILWF